MSSSLSTQTATIPIKQGNSNEIVVKPNETIAPEPSQSVKAAGDADGAGQVAEAEVTPGPEVHAELKVQKVAEEANEPEEGKYDIAAGEKKLSIVAFASSPGPGLCKVIMSAIAMGYPIPIIVNWQKHLADVFPDYLRKKGNLGSHLLKVTGSLDFLDEISHPTAPKDERLEEDDLVLLVDAYDVWFQTPPSVLIQRYHEANKLANQRLAKLWPGKKEDMPMKQSIVISSQKKCWPTPTSAYQMQCEHLPDSPLRSDLYGDETDKPGQKGFHDNRPKYINSGAIMGPVGDLRRYIRAVKARLDDKKFNEPGSMQSDQGMFGEIFGEQELYRSWLRLAASEDEHGMEELFMLNRDYEYGVGLDYKQDICIATVFEEKDGEIFPLNNQTLIRDRSQDLEIDPPRLKGVPKDLAESANPLKLLDPEDMTEWGDMPMYADFFTTAVPSMVHHNAHAGGLKDRNQKWWDHMWYFPYLRDLVTARLSSNASQPIGRVRNLAGEDVIYRAVPGDAQKRVPRIYEPGKAKDGMELAEWETICEFIPKKKDEGKKLIHWSEEVFRDGLGGMNGETLDTPPSDEEQTDQ